MNNQKQAVKNTPFDTTGIVIFSSICLGSFGLGVWQLQRWVTLSTCYHHFLCNKYTSNTTNIKSLNFFHRYNWKANLVSAVGEISLDDAMELPSSPTQKQLTDDLISTLGRRFVLTGRFDHSKGTSIRTYKDLHAV